MDINFAEVITQLPVAAVLVFVVFRFLDHLRDERESTNQLLEKMNSDNVIAIREMHSETLAFIGNQAETNREFLKTQREHMNEGMTRLAEEIKTNKISSIREMAEIAQTIDKVIDKMNHRLQS